MGIGGEVLQIGQDIMCYRWFAMANFNFSLNILAALEQAGMALDEYISPRLYQYTKKLCDCFFIGFGICVISSICTFILTVLEKKAEKKDQKEEKKHNIRVKDVRRLKSLFWYVCIFALIGFTSLWTIL